jgi:hypothetical protein
MFNWTNLLKDNQMKAFKRCNERKFSKDAIKRQPLEGYIYRNICNA